ncbi:MAG: dockerin type I domain-containing protein [Lachnospiraceae bacterium]
MKQFFKSTLLLIMSGIALYIGMGVMPVQAETTDFFTGSQAGKAACIWNGEAAVYYDTVMDAMNALNDVTADTTCYIRGGTEPVVYEEAFTCTVTVPEQLTITVAAYGGEAVVRATSYEKQLFTLSHSNLVLGADTGTLTIDFHGCDVGSSSPFSVGAISTMTLQKGLVICNANVNDTVKHSFTGDVSCLFYAWYNGEGYNAQIVMDGATIRDCQVDEYAHLIYLRKGAIFTMNAGSITGNTLGETSSAVYARDYQYCEINLSGGTVKNENGYALRDTVSGYSAIRLSGTPSVGRICHESDMPIEASGYRGDPIAIVPKTISEGALCVSGTTDTASFLLEDKRYQLTADSERNGLCIVSSSLTSSEIIQSYLNPDFVPQAAEVKTRDEATGIMLVHPGIVKNKAILDQTKDHVRNGDQQWVDAFLSEIDRVHIVPRVSEHAKAEDDFTIGSKTVDEKPTYLQPFEDDAKEALQQVDLWYVTGEPVFLSNALQIIRGWCHLQSVGDVFDEQIQASRGVYYMCQAAEILRYSNSGWTEQDTENFLHLLTVLEPKYNRITHFMNQDGECINATMAAALFRNDVQTYHKCVERMTINPELTLQCREKGYTAEDAECSPDRPCLHSRSGAILYQIREVTHDARTGEAVEPNIQLVEMGRDQVHPGADIYCPARVGIMTYLQGTLVDPATGCVTQDMIHGKNVFEYLDHRLLKGADYYCRYNSEEQEVVDAMKYYPAYKGETETDYYEGFSGESGKSKVWHDYIVGLLYHYYQSFYPQLNTDEENPMDTYGTYVEKAYQYAFENGENDMYFNIPTEEDVILMKEPDIRFDFNGDGRTDAADALLLQEKGFREQHPTATQKMLYDCNDDGVLDERDVHTLLSLEVVGAQVRTDGKDGFRFVSELNVDSVRLEMHHANENKTGKYTNQQQQTIQYGTLLIPAAIVDNAVEQRAGQSKEDILTISVAEDFTLSANAVSTTRGQYKPALVQSKVVFEEFDSANKIQYTAVLAGMDSYKDKPFYARAYCVIDGKVIYSDVITRTWNDVYASVSEKKKYIMTTGSEEWKEVTDIDSQ